MRPWLVITAAGAGTYALRASLILLLARIEVPPLLDRSFRYVAPAAMAALAVPAFVAPGGTVSFAAPHVAAGVAGGLVAWRWHSVPATLAAGFVAYGLVALLA